MPTIQTKVNDEIKPQTDEQFKNMGKKPNAQTLAALEADDENTYQNVEELSKLWK